MIFKSSHYYLTNVIYYIQLFGSLIFCRHKIFSLKNMLSNVQSELHSLYSYQLGIAVTAL